MRIKMVNVIRGFIKSKPDLADDDFGLMWGIWDWELRNIKPSRNILKFSARDLVQSLKDKTLTSPSAIGRARRKCQEMFPETRGECYEQRHDEQKRVISDLKAAERDTSIERRESDPLKLE